MMFVAQLSWDLVLIWLSATLLAKQSSWYCQADLDLGIYVWEKLHCTDMGGHLGNHKL